MRKSFRGILLATLFGLLVTLGSAPLRLPMPPSSAPTTSDYPAGQHIRTGSLSRDTKVTGEVYKVQSRVAYFCGGAFRCCKYPTGTW